jgi:hypothetical protein
MRRLFRFSHGTGAAGVTLAAALCATQAIAGPPFRTDDPEPVDYQHWEFYLFSTGTHVRGDTTATLPGVEINYGVLPDLQLHVIAPVAFDNASGNGAQYGYGDTELGVKCRFIQEDENGWRPMVGVFPLLELPTGNANRGLGTGSVHAYLPVWLQKSFGDWTTYGGGGYWINPGVGNKNYAFAGWLLQRKITDNLAFGGEIFHQTADVIGGKDQTGFNLGGIYDITENHHILFSAGRGIQNAPTTNGFSYYVAYQLTF